MASKTCFVTIGATASFSALIKAVLSAPFLSALQSQQYTELLIQYGQDGKDLYDGAMKQAKATVDSSGIKVTAFDLDKAGLGRYMRQAKGTKGAQEGVVISHAGMPIHHPHTVHFQRRLIIARLWHDP